MILSVFAIVLVGSGSWLGYVFLGYPVLVRLLARAFGTQPRTDESEPPVALVISAFNEASCIEDKLDNCLALDYPPERIRFVVSSDGSTDATNTLVARRVTLDTRVTLYAHSVNRGKTAALSETVRRLPDDISVVIFSDANALYHPDAVRKLVRNFADPDVGCVCGELRYRTDSGEGAYRSWENRIREAQSALGIPPSAEGSIFAIRRDLMPDLPASVMEDLVIPYRIAATGFRVVWEPLAISEEVFTLDTARRMSRRRRIVNRAVRALPHIPFAWNPRESGWVAFHFISHRVLRWLAPFALFAGWAAGIAIGIVDRDYLWLSALSVVVAILAGAASVLHWFIPHRWRSAMLPAEFVLANIAIFLGVLSAARGSRIERWTPSR